MMFRFYLFGPPRLERDGVPIHISRQKGVALLSYLAQTNQPSSRETLATLLWPDHDQTEALKSLRRELSRLKKELGGESLKATRRQLTFNADASSTVDVVRFQRQLQLAHEHDHFPEIKCPSCLEALTEAVNLYSDDFMAGFNLPDCPEFDTWQDFQRESLRQDLGQALHQLTLWHASQRDYDRAIYYSRRWLALDPLHETARQALMQVYAEASQPAGALRVYEEGVQLLKKELGIPPSYETRRLWQAIRAGRVPDINKGAIAQSNLADRAPSVRSRPPRSKLPQQPTPFVGRSREVTMVQLRLQEPSCRLINLVGPGGIGKTRLALEVGRCVLDKGVPDFADGVFFVPLALVSAAEGIASAMLEAAGISLYGIVPQEQELLGYLRDKQMLFILDNLDHLPECSDTITGLLATAPGVKILATSRAALRLQEEWFHPLGGLSVPPPSSPVRRHEATGNRATSLRSYDAVQLFEQRAQHASPNFSLDKDVEHVVRICRLVEGMPLALELAAAWLKVLDTRAVADELEQSLDLLYSRFHNMPERHQSVRAVFLQTWVMLEPAEQEVLARLSVFQGGFTREAAVQVADATLLRLSGLVEKALLHTTTHGRYRLHELLRQFAAEQLEEMGIVEESRTAHFRYYMANLAQRETELKGAMQRIALKRIKNNLENIRLAWNWALDHDEMAAVAQALESIFLYFFVRGRNQEGVDFLQSAYSKLAPRDGEKPKAIWGRIGSRVCLMKSHMSPETDIEAKIQSSLVAAQRYQDQAEIAFCHFVLGIYNTLIRENAVAAVKSYEQARQVYRDLNDSFYLVQVLIWMGFSYGNSSHLDRYFALTQKALDLARAAGHRASAAHALGNLVGGAFCIGDYATAEQYACEVGEIGEDWDLPNMITHSKMQLCLASFLKGEIDRAGRLAREAHELALEIHYPLSIAYTLTFLGLHASICGDYLSGKRFGEESLATHAPRFGVIMGHWAVAIANCGLDEDAEGWRHTITALELAHLAGFSGMTTWPLPVMAIFLARAGQPERATELLALAQSHPLSPTGWQNRWHLLTELCSCLEAELGADAFAAAWERGQALDLDTVIATTLENQDLAAVHRKHVRVVDR